MNIEQIIASLQTSLRDLSGSLFLPGGGEFANKLAIGQIIKGRVLRHYEGNRYLVSFDGQEKVVDSAVPLRPQEIIHGRVVGLGEKIELKRVALPRLQTSKDNVTSQIDGMIGFGKSEQLLSDMVTQYQAKLSIDDQSILLRLMKSVSDPVFMAQAGVALNKLGLTITPDLAKSLYDTLTSRIQSGLFPLTTMSAPLLSAAIAQEVGSEKGSNVEFGKVVAKLMEDIPEKRLSVTLGADKQNKIIENKCMHEYNYFSHLT